MPGNVIRGGCALLWRSSLFRGCHWGSHKFLRFFFRSWRQKQTMKRRVCLENSNPPTSIFVIMCIIMVTITIIITIPLINRVRGPYCKLQTEFFPLGFKDRETRLVRYILCLWVQIEEEDFSSNKILNLAGRSVNYSSLNWLIIFDVPTKRCNQVWTRYSIFLWNKPLGS